MNKLGIKICRLVLYLDRIPRYGRLYAWHSETRTTGPAEWKWQKRGYWGTNILDKADLYWHYVDITNPGWMDEKSSTIGEE